jgi:Uncharacterised nucleotidyltransferase
MPDDSDNVVSEHYSDVVISHERQKLVGAFWPTSLQERLLEIAIGPPNEAARAWTCVRPSFCLDKLEPGSFALMPLVYRALAGSGSNDPLLPRLKGIYRRSWVVNNVLLERTAEVAGALRRAGIRALFIEGPLLGTRFYGEHGLRPSGAVDVLVDPDAADAAVRVLARAGWNPRSNRGGRHREPRLLVDPAGNLCLLRTTIAADSGGADLVAAHAPLWESSEALDVGGVEVMSTSATDTLLSVCLGHAQGWQLPRLRWIVDAVMVTRTSSIDWDRASWLAGLHGQRLRLRDALSYVSDVAPPSLEIVVNAVPPPVSRRERVAHYCGAGAVPGLGIGQAVLAEYLSISSSSSMGNLIRGFPRFLRERWDTTTLGLPVAATRRMAASIRRRGPTT